MREKQLFEDARQEFNAFVKNHLFHTGVALYWAEGSKRNSFFAFSNSDPDMINLMVSWIENFLDIPRSRQILRLYIHKPYAHENCEDYWAKVTQIPRSNFRKTVYKPTSLLVKKRPAYKGCIRISLPNSLSHLKKMIFWQRMLIEYYRMW